jgi:CDP-glucose 4,6-dehydratase
MFENIYKNKKVLITGNTGFKGSWLTMWLHALEAKLYGISKGTLPTAPSMFEVLDLQSKLEYHEQNLLDAEATHRIIDTIRPDFVFHLAAQAIVGQSYQDPLDTFATNVMGTAHVLDSLRKINHPCTVVVITSDKAYDNVEWKWGYRENEHLGGKDPYSASKGAAELVIKGYYHSFFSQEDSPVKLVVTRAGNVIGGGDWAEKRIVPDCFRAWHQQQPVEIRSPQATRPWQHVLEPLSGYLRAGQLLYQQPKLNGEAYNFGPNSDQNHTVLELLQELGKYWNKEATFDINAPKSFHEAGLLKLNCDKALHDLAWKPTLNFTETAAFTTHWYNQYYDGASSSELFEFTKEQINTYSERAKENGHLWSST